MKMGFPINLVLCMLVVSTVVALKTTPSTDTSSLETTGRRNFLISSLGGLVLGASLPVGAFENRIAPRKYPPQPGPEPRDLGVRLDGSLKACGDAPNCFSSSADPEIDPSHYLTPFKFAKSKEDAMKDVVKAIKKYQPGENDIDGGGWEVKKVSDSYVYIQFESLKHGYIDDVEFSLRDDGTMLVRSSSRIGYLDFQTNAKRVNALAKSLDRAGGWETTRITPKTHPAYFSWNRE